MTPERWKRLRAAIEAALEAPLEMRDGVLADACSGEPTLLSEARAMIRAAQDTGGFLQAPPVDGLAPWEQPSLAGQTVGAYVLVSEIGHGGMGSVWLARRSDGRFEGQAAVKLLNASMVGRVGGERFKREGNILARLTHPHIAHLIDAGVSAAGQPYLVLEHVEGQEIDRYCDEKGLAVDARVRLFLDVLAAVAHAHANLIVHRDIKPSNVLVSTDGEVKLLDFGIAKLLEGEARAGEETALTREGGRALTPEYAAPEQLTGGHVTTATDVYSLGVLLYVLLAGHHPTGEGTLSAARLLRAIVDTEAQRLSEAVHSTRPQARETLTEAAARRATTPDKLRRLLQGDLDTIVAKALKKNPQERYESVTALADDLRKYLGHQPISARPDTFAYLTAKFVRRHRVPVTLGLLVLFALVAGLGGTIWQAREAARQRDLVLAMQERAEGINEFNTFLLGQAAPGGKAVTTRDLVERAERMVEKRFANEDGLGVELLVTIGHIYNGLQETDNAIRSMKRAYETSLRFQDPALRAEASCGWARVVGDSGNYADARRLFDSALALLSNEARFDNVAANCLLDRASTATLEGDTAATLQNAQMVLERLSSRNPTAFAATRAHALHLLAMANEMQGETGKAEQAFGEAMQHLERIGRGDTPAAGTLLNNWARIRAATDTLAALAMQERAIAALQGTESADSVPAACLANQGRLLNQLARYAQARLVCERGTRIARKHDNVRTVGTCRLGEARACRSLGDLECAATALDEAERMLRSAFPPGHFSLADLTREKGLLAAARGDTASAQRLLSEALPLHEKASEKHVSHVETLLELAKLSLQIRDFEEAEKQALRGLELGRRFQADAPLSSWVGLSQLALGTIREARGNSARARECLREALAHLPATLGEFHPAVQEVRTRLAAHP